MRKLIVQEFLTLDGVMQAPGEKNEDTEGGFKNGGWQIPYTDEVFGKIIVKAFTDADALLLGRKTYDLFAAYWPTAKVDLEIAKPINKMAKYVASRTLDNLTWQNSHLLKGDIIEEIKKVKDQAGPPAQAGKNILVIGSGDFAQTFMQGNLIDEYQLFIHPLVLGNGKKLFREGGPKQNLTLLHSEITTKGVVILNYVPSFAKATEGRWG